MQTEARPCGSIVQRSVRQIAILSQWASQSERKARTGACGVVPVPWADYMVPVQKNGEDDGSSQWRRGLNYLSTHYVSKDTYNELNQLQLNPRQSDIYADIFGAGTVLDGQGDKESATNVFGARTAVDNPGVRRIRESVAGAHVKLWSVLGDQNVQFMHDKRYAQLGKAAAAAGEIRDKLDMVGKRGWWGKKLAPMSLSHRLLAKSIWEFSVRFGVIPESTSGGPQPLSHGFTLSTAIVQNLPHALGISWVLGDSARKLLDWWQPKYRTGIEDRREDMARLAAAFLENSTDAKAVRAGGTAAASLVRTYGEDGRDFLENLITAVDHNAYNYMEALQRSTPRAMPTDEHLAETGVTSAARQLTYSRLEMARFVNTFTDRPEGGQAVVKYWKPDDDDPVFRGVNSLLWAKDPFRG